MCKHANKVAGLTALRDVYHGPSWAPHRATICGGVALVMLGSMLWGVSLCAAQGTQDAPSPDAIDPPTMLADQFARLAAASVAWRQADPANRAAWVASLDENHLATIAATTST